MGLLTTTTKTTTRFKIKFIKKIMMVSLGLKTKAFFLNGPPPKASESQIHCGKGDLATGTACELFDICMHSLSKANSATETNFPDFRRFGTLSVAPLCRSLRSILESKEFHDTVGKLLYSTQSSAHDLGLIPGSQLVVICKHMSTSVIYYASNTLEYTEITG